LQLVGFGLPIPIFGAGTGGGISEVAGGIVSGGVQFVESGGIASGTVLTGNGTVIVNLNNSPLPLPGVLELVLSGGTAEDTVVGSGGVQDVLSGGTAVGTTIGSGGIAEFFGGATVADTIVQSGGTLDVGPGYVVTDFVIDGGAVLEIDSGGTAAGTTTIEDGTLVLDSGAVVGQVAFGPKGSLVVSGTSVPAGLLLDQIFLGDRIDLLSVPFAGSGTVSATGGTALDVGGVELLFYTYLTGKTFLLSSDGVGGTLITLSATVVGSGSAVTVSPGQSDAEVVVLSGGTLNVLSGGTADDVTLSGGTLNVASGGTATNVSISGGTEFVSGVDLGGTVNDGGSQVLLSGGALVDQRQVGVADRSGA